MSSTERTRERGLAPGQDCSLALGMRFQLNAKTGGISREPNLPLTCLAAMLTLEALGWDADWAARFAPLAEAGWVPGRIAAEHRGRYHYLTAGSEGTAEICGKLRYAAGGRGDFPAVGDWVALQPGAGSLAIVQAIVPRRNRLARRAAGREVEEQIIAANLDTLFAVTSCNRDLNPRRIERYLAAACASDIRAVLLLNKSDLCADPEALADSVRAVIPGLEVQTLSATTGAGVATLEPYLGPGRTVAMLGSSGVGKSTLLNRLLGQDWQRVQDIRDDDDRGRHTTTHREMLFLPSGGLLIDNPGIRELGVWDEESNLDSAFTDVAELASSCYYPDCTHQHEPRCAVRQAVDEGRLDPGRLENYAKLQRELAYIERKQDPESERARRERERRFFRSFYKLPKRRKHQ